MYFSFLGISYGASADRIPVVTRFLYCSLGVCEYACPLRRSNLLLYDSLMNSKLLPNYYLIATLLLNLCKLKVTEKLYYKYKK